MRSLLAAFARPATATLSAASAASTAPSQGLLQVSYVAAAARLCEAVLEALVAEAREPALRRPLALGPQAREGWLAIHGHLLPDGPCPVTLRLRIAGRIAAEHRLTLQVRNEGPTARAVAASLKARGAPLVVDEAVDSGLYDYADPGFVAWFDRPPAEAEAHIAALAAAGASAEEAAALRHFVSEGYLVLPDVISPEHLGRLNAALDDAVARKVEGYEWGESRRIHNLHEAYPAIRELWLHPKVLRMLELIFGEPAKPCQSLTYVFGSEQEHHQDTIHLTAFPAGRMCGVWSALEDVQPDSGELIVFPGSHRARRVYMKDAGAAKVTGDWSEFGDKVVRAWTGLIEAGGYRREVYRPKAGTVLIWHENLMHAGSPRRDRDRSRRSIVGHYFARGSVVYYDSSGLPACLYEGETA